VFTLGSLACALSGSLTALVASRIVQGFGGAGIMSVNNALIRFIYPSDQLGRGIGINALVASISAAVGPSVASGILSIGSWQWLFAINVPLGVAVLALSRRAVPRTPLAHHRFDWLSALLSAITFGALISGIENLRRFSMAVALELTGAAFAGALFTWRQRLLAYPMLALELFARPVFTLSVVTSICSFTAQNLAFVSLPFFVEEVLGRSAVETGLLMTPWPVAVGFAAPVAGWLADRNYPAGTLGGIGLAILGLGLVLVASQEVHAAVSRIAWCMVICGIGFGLLPIPQQPHHPCQRTAGTRRQRQWRSRHRPARRANPGRGPGRPNLRADEREPAWHRPRRHLVPARRRRLCRGRRGGEQPAAFRLSSGRAAAIPLTRRVRAVRGRSGQNRLV
jgi:DHA2 family multidrug resistance protein-like MFS transporter